jgi:hypothetical protein
MDIMIEDSALILKKRCDREEKIPPQEVQELLNQSDLISKLLETPNRPPNTYVGLRNYMWRLVELSEIPFTHTLEKVQEWIKLLVEKSYISEGFTLEGKRDNLLACHSAMITTILIRMEYEDMEKINAGIDWILKYQSVERGKECTWEGKDLYTRFGGCMKKIPCFYGVVKSMKALSEYNKYYGGSEKLTSKLNQGLEYILEHDAYKKLSNGNPIEDSMIQNFYPYTYKSNLIEILALLKENGLLEDKRCCDAIQILKKKQRSDGFWQADVSYMKSVWIDFDVPKKPGPWITHVINQVLTE